MIALAVVLALAPAAAAARTFWCSGGDAACVIAAVEESNASDKDAVLLLGRGVYTLDPATHPSLIPDGLTSTGKLTIKGVGADSTVIQRAAGAPPFRILTGLSRLTIEGVSILGGDATDTSCACGGGIFSSGILIISASRVSMNRSSGAVVPNQPKGYGGGIAAGQLTIIDSLISQNRSATNGGGISAGSATIIGSTISANIGQDGGGISAGRLAITDSAIIGNAGRFGGGIFPGGDGEHANYTLTNTTIAENSASFGGAIQVGIPDAPPGAIHTDGAVTITNSTISQNRASVGAGGIGGPNGPSSGDLVISLRGTILAQNLHLSGGPPIGDCAGALSLSSAGHNFLGKCDMSLQDTDLGGDPRLDALADDGTPGNAHLPLLSGSPAIDAGGTAPQSHEAGDCPPRDQINRRREGACDIGAIEFRLPHHHKHWQ
jgi:predicted outer membrane repeat protein